MIFFFERSTPTTKKTLNGCLPLEHGSHRRETLGKRVSDDSPHFIFRRPKILLAIHVSKSLALFFVSRILRFGGARDFERHWQIPR